MIRRLLLVTAFFTLYACALFYPLLLGREALFWHDVSIAYLPLRTAAAEAIREGRLPLWEPRMGNGFPVLAEGQAGVFYPPHVLGYLGLPQYQVYALMVALHCVLAGVFMALFCRLWRLGLAACLTAGLIYAFSGFFITHVLHVTMLEAAAWLPLALLCAERWLRNPRDLRWAAGAALALGVQQLVAMPQIFFYSALAVVLYMLVGALGRPGNRTDPHTEATPPVNRPRWAARVAAVTGVVIAAGVLVAAVQIIPTAGIVRASAREAVTPEQLRELSLAPRNLAYFVHPYLLGSYAGGDYFGRDHHYEVCGFAGTVALLLGLVGAVYGRGRGRVFAVALVPLALFMALANQNPLYEVFPHIPVLNWFRGAGRYVLLSSLGLAILAAWGIQAVTESVRARKLCLWLGLAAIVLCISMATGFRLSREAVIPRLEGMVSVSDEDGPGAPRAAAEEKFSYLAARLGPADPTFLLLLLTLAALTGACALSMRRPAVARWLPRLALALTVLQLYSFARDYNPSIDPAYYHTPPTLAGLLDSARGECVYLHDQQALQEALPGEAGWADGDLSYYWRERELLRPNRQVLYGVRSANVFYALTQKRYWTLHNLLTRSLDGETDPDTGLQVRRTGEVLSTLGARLVSTAGREVLPDWPVAAEFETWLARRNPDPAPEAYFAEAVVPSWDEQAALRHLAGPGFRWRRPVVELGRDAAFITAPGDTPPRILGMTRAGGTLTVQCEVSGHAFLVLRQMYDPNLVCRVDGVPAMLYRANYLFSGVEVGPGRHVVELSYGASHLVPGMVISALALVGLLVCLVCGRRGDE